MMKLMEEKVLVLVLVLVEAVVMSGLRRKIIPTEVVFQRMNWSLRLILKNYIRRNHNHQRHMICYGLLLEYTTSGGRKLHELSFLFVTSGLYTLTAAAGRYVRGETPTTIPPSRFAILGLTSMGSTFTSVRSLRYVIYPIQVLAKSCKPVPVMLMGTLMGKRYDLRKYMNVVMIVIGVAFFMGGGDNSRGKDDGEEKSSSSQILGILLLFISLCFDGGTGAYG